MMATIDTNTYEIDYTSASTALSPYFYECEEEIINLAKAINFYVASSKMSSIWSLKTVAPQYFPSVRTEETTFIRSYSLTGPMNTKEKAMEFLRDLTKKIEAFYRKSHCHVITCSHPQLSHP